MYKVKARRGMLSWKVCGQETVEEAPKEGEVQKVKRLIVFDSFADVKPHQKVKESMFPPSAE